jgi:hypothetical protein
MAILQHEFAYEDQTALRLRPLLAIALQHSPPIGQAIQLLKAGDCLQCLLKLFFTQISPIDRRRVTRSQTNP